MLHRFLKENAGLLVVLIASFVFVVTRIVMLIKFDGSSIDEYWHITSGISLFESAKFPYFYNDLQPYMRGSLMSFWVGLWITLFGKSILVAKLAAISIGITNYCLLLYLSVKLVDKKQFQLLLLLLYSLSPWCMFNNFYIRMYALYELFLLIFLVLGFKMYKAMRDAHWRKTALLLSLVIALNILNMVTNTDAGRYMLLLASAVMIASLFIYEFNVVPSTSRGVLSLIAGNIFLSTPIYRAVVTVIIAVLAFIALDAGSQVELLMNKQLEYTSLPEYKYTWLFWEKNGVITVFFVLAVATFWRKNNGFEKNILPVAGALFLVHVASSDDLQVTRAVTYFMPLYYITAVIGVSKVSYPSEWLWSIVISSMFLFVTVTNVSRDYYWGPYITGETNYIEYSRLYDSVKRHCSGHLIIEAAPSSPFIARFYGVNVDYVLSAAGNVEKDTQYVIDVDTGKFKTVWGAVPVLTDINDLNLLDKDICLIVRSPSQKRFFPSTAKDMLRSAEKSWNFSNISLYLLEGKSLTDNQ